MTPSSRDGIDVPGSRTVPSTLFSVTMVKAKASLRLYLHR
jgi:hypothetical protein